MSSESTSVTTMDPLDKLWNFKYDYTHSEMMFHRRYHGLHYYKSWKGLVMDPTALIGTEPFNPITADVQVSIYGVQRTWALHSKAICQHSNFFRRALTGGFIESSTKNVKLYGIKPRSMDFVFNYIYSEWPVALERTYKVSWAPNMRASIAAEILLTADYLDMPRPAYEAYYNIVSQLASLAVQFKHDCQFRHNMCVRQRPFLEAADMLEKSETPVGRDLAGAIRRCIKELRKAERFYHAIQAFNKNFPHDHVIMYMKLG